MNCFETNRSCANGHNGNLVYLTKVFFDGQENSSPMMTSLTTKPGAFTQQLSIGGPVSRGLRFVRRLRHGDRLRTVRRLRQRL